jgi:hypothetical protein
MRAVQDELVAANKPGMSARPKTARRDAAGIAARRLGESLERPTSYFAVQK